MKRNFDTIYTNIAGEPIQEQDKPVMTRKDLTNIAIGFSDTRECSSEEKAKKFAILVKTANGGVVDLKSEEVTLLKRIAGECLFTLAYGRFIEFLEADYIPETGKK